MAKDRNAPLVTLGTWVDGYQAVDRAPVDYVQGSRQRKIDGHLITGSWSDPWWLYSKEKGWALARHWKNPERKVPAFGGARATWVTVQARWELVITPWSPHYAYCATTPCPAGCPMAHSRDEALQVWERVWRDEDAGGGRSAWSAWTLLTSGFGIALGASVLAGTPPVANRWLAGPLMIACCIIAGAIAIREG